MRSLPPGMLAGMFTTAALAASGAARSSQPILHLPKTLPARVLRVPILMYHRIDYANRSLPQITQRLTVDPRDFAAQMTWLKRSGFHTVTQRQLFAALERGARLPAKPVMITFDDGYRDVFGKASETIARLGLRATAYVITGRISGSDVSFLTWPQLKTLEARGIEIGSHTVSHRGLTGLSTAAATQELVSSRSVLERRLGHPVQWLAYPLGDSNARIVRLARRAGYVLAVTTQRGSRQDARAPLELRRYEILDSTHVSGLAALLP